jgi:hypothetical protein
MMRTIETFVIQTPNRGRVTLDAATYGCRRCGAFYVHRKHTWTGPSPTHWSVTLIVTGVCVASYLRSRERARRLARELEAIDWTRPLLHTDRLLAREAIVRHGGSFYVSDCTRFVEPPK